ncbi:MAG: Cytochrome [Phenylobacterium sp.]|nr:Cytochrome [Phenylobacterium sp.]
MNDVSAAFAKVPPHVPRELILDFVEGGERDFAVDPYAVFRRLAKTAPPLFYTPRDPRVMDGGAWVVTTADYAREVLQNPDPFCNSIRYASDDAAFPRRLLPLGVDPPEHLKFRAVIAPIFSPKAIDRIESDVYRIANAQIDTFAKSGRTDFMHTFARVFPGTVFMLMMGMPLENREQFFQWEEKFFHDGTNEEKRQVGLEIHSFMVDLIKEKRRRPGEDIITQLTKSEIDGKPLSDDIIYDFCFLLYIAGLDTVNGGLGHIWRYLAEHPEAQAELRADPSLVREAVEELLRVHSWIAVSRVLSRDHEFHGVQMRKDERVVVLAELPCWDPKDFPDPYKVDFHRPVNPHLAFGGGVHRCAGSHLARRELRVGLAEWLRRIPEWRIEPGAKPAYFTDGLLSLRNLPLVWDGAKAI